jgi:hypothetical protein
MQKIRLSERVSRGTQEDSAPLQDIHHTPDLARPDDREVTLEWRLGLEVTLARVFELLPADGRENMRPSGYEADPKENA